MTALRTCIDFSSNFSLTLALFPSISVDTGAILRLALTETNSNVALEFDGVTIWELERVKYGGQVTGGRVIVPVAENVWIGGTAIFISYSVKGIHIVVIHCSGNAISCKSTINFTRLNLKLIHFKYHVSRRVE